MTDVQAVPPPDPVAVMQNTQATWLDLPASWPDGRDVARKLAEMLVSRYSGQPTPRDVDVAKVAYAAGAAQFAERANALWQRAKTCNAEASHMPDSEFKRWLKAWVADALDLLWEVGGRDADLLDGQP